jgi:hypothetical protein
VKHQWTCITYLSPELFPWWKMVRQPAPYQTKHDVLHRKLTCFVGECDTMFLKKYPRICVWEGCFEGIFHTWLRAICNRSELARPAVVRKVLVNFPTSFINSVVSWNNILEGFSRARPSCWTAYASTPATERYWPNNFSGSCDSGNFQAIMWLCWTCRSRRVKLKFISGPGVWGLHNIFYIESTYI